MNAFLLTWNPKYYQPKEELRRLKEAGYCNSFWSTNGRQMEPGNHLYLMRQGKEPRGIVAHGFTRQYRTFVNHRGRWYVSVMWKWFKPEDPIFSLDDLNMLFPDQHWSPRGSGIQIKPPVDEEFIALAEKAIEETRNP